MEFLTWGNVIYLTLTSFFTGALLNRWVLFRKHNGEGKKFLITSMVITALVICFLSSHSSPYWDEAAFLSLSILLPMAMGIFADEKIIHKWINGKGKEC